MVTYKTNTAAALFNAAQEKKLWTTKLGGGMPENESKIRGLKQSLTSARENKMSSSAAKSWAAMAQATIAWRNRLRRG